MFRPQESIGVRRLGVDLFSNFLVTTSACQTQTCVHRVLLVCASNLDVPVTKRRSTIPYSVGRLVLLDYVHSEAFEPATWSC